MIGQRIGSIRLESRLGEGGMGEVFLGFDERLQRRVAVKTIRSTRRMTPEVKARFLREARLLSKLEHPNICRVYDLVEHEQNDFLILEYLEGRTLRQIMADEMEPLGLLHLAEEIATALAVAHEQRIVHRDLKPDNIMLTTDGRTKVLDFGLARSVDGAAAPQQAKAEPALETDDTVALGPGGRDAEAEPPGESDTADLTRRGSIVGTVRYMSPEQACGQAVTEASDLYALGLILQELATGRPAYVAANSVEMLLRASQADTVPVSGVDPELAELIKQLTALDPQVRPTAEATIGRLRALQNKPRLQRRRRRAAVVAVVVAAVVVITGVLSYQLARPRAILDQGGRVVLLPFVNRTGDPRNDWVELGLTQMVVQTVDAAEGIDVVSVEQLLDAMGRLGLERGAELDQEQLQRLMSALGVACTVRCTVSAAATDYSFNYSVHRAGGKALSKSLAASELTAGASELADRLVLRLRPDAEPVALSDRFSEDPFANRSYAMAVQQGEAAGPQVASYYYRVCLDRDRQMVRARLGLAAVLHLMGSVDESRAMVEELIVAPEVARDSSLQAAIKLLQGKQHFAAAEYSEAVVDYSEAVRNARESGDVDGILNGLNALGGARYYGGELHEAERIWQEAMEVAKEHGLIDSQSRLLNNLGIVAYENGDLDRAEVMWSEAMARMQLLGSRVVEALIVGNLGLIAEDRGDLAAALDFHQQELELQRELGDRMAEAIASYNYANTARRIGGYAEAEAESRRCLEVAREVENRMIEALCAAELGLLLARRGDLQESGHLVDEALRVAEGTESSMAKAAAFMVAADLAIRRGDLEAADSLLLQAEKLGPDDEIIMVRARWHRAAGKNRRALESAESARAAAGTAWTPNQQAELELYRSVVGTGMPPHQD